MAVQPVGSAMDATGAGDRSDVVPRPEPAADSETVEWARARFELAGIKAPSAPVVFASHGSGCGDHLGRFLPDEGLVEICLTEDAPDLALRQLVLHELAHAWANEHLADSERDDFVVDRGLSNWNDHDVAWGLRGTEHAAETIAWGLLDVEVDLHHAIGGSRDRQSLHDTFVALTGVEPINDGEHGSADPTPLPETRPVVRQ